jgi:chaperone required for assembly of F1-ATPase
MKRFYKTAEVAAGPDHWSVVLDQRPIRTPGKRALALPTIALAEAVAGEWAEQGEEIVPESMPMTQLANTALDRVAPEREAILAQITDYAGTDLLCYRADQPAELAGRQAAAWDPMLAWADATFGARLDITAGIIHRPQDPAAVGALVAPARALDPFALTGLSVATTLTGSAVLGWALTHARLSTEEALALAHVDEDFQIERWGEDTEAMRRRAALARDLEAAARLIALVRP